MQALSLLTFLGLLLLRQKKAQKERSLAALLPGVAVER